jgi:hypothetical protein
LASQPRQLTGDSYATHENAPPRSTDANRLLV